MQNSSELDQSRVPSASTYGLDPPRPPKEGFEWVWFPDGYWAERERVDFCTGPSGKGLKWRKKSDKKSSSRETRETESSLSRFSPKGLKNQFSPQSLDSSKQAREAASRAPLPSPYLTESDHVLSLQRPPLHQNTSDESKWSSSQQDRLGIWWSKTQNNSPLSTNSDTHRLNRSVDTSRLMTSFSAKQSPISSSSVHSKTSTVSVIKTKTSLMGLLSWSKGKEKEKLTDVAPSYDIYTQNTLQGVKYQLQHSANPKPLARISSMLRDDNNKSPSSNGNKHRQRKLFGRSPWHRKTSRGSETSVSSSIRDMLRGRTPQSTPIEKSLEDLGCSRYEWSESFPGGEARRIKTPPVHPTCRYSPATSSSFFNAVGARYHPTTSPPTPQPAPKPRKGRHMQNLPLEFPRRKHQNNDWWEVSVATPRWRDLGPKSFEFDMPEHLPNSPMCPTNKRHKSGGTGVCVYHGRRKRSVKTEDVVDDSMVGSGNTSAERNNLEGLLVTDWLKSRN